jgi:hypothetical protein
VPESGAGQVALASPLKNSGAKAERLLGASTPMAASVTLLDGKGKPGSGVTVPARGQPTLSCSARTFSLAASKGAHGLRQFRADLALCKRRLGKVDVMVGPAAGG